MTKRMLLVLLALGLVLAAMFGWKYYQSQKMAALASMPPPPATVAATEVQTETWQPYLAAVGSLVATQGIMVTTEVAGKVHAIRFESGQQVEAGTLLLEIDDSFNIAVIGFDTAVDTPDAMRFFAKRPKELLSDICSHPAAP